MVAVSSMRNGHGCGGRACVGHERRSPRSPIGRSGRMHGLDGVQMRVETVGDVGGERHVSRAAGSENICW